MIKKTIIILLIISLVGISGCTIKQTTNETFGEKKPVGAESLFVLNSTGDHYDRNNTTTYYVWGYIGNNAGEEARNINITVQTFDASGKLFGTNSTTSLRPKNIPPEGSSYFYVGFNDTKKLIKNYKINITTF
ncbi:MAG: FxLYD domain-containing protein [Methanobacterium sp.]